MGKMAAFDLTTTGRIDNMLKDLEAAQRFSIGPRTPMPLPGRVTELHRMMSAAYMKLFELGRSTPADL